MSSVTLCEYTAAWRAGFDRISGEVGGALAGADGLCIEHIGSTAVPGMCAKPVIDVLVGVTNLQDIEARKAGLGHLGFRYRPEHEAEIPDRRYFVQEPGANLRVHLHAVVLGGSLWRSHLAFRATLRRDARLAAEYAALKRKLAALHAQDKLAYTQAKTSFIRQALAVGLGD
jgi:GrpB-like predicted nucleotidyltransferase (UPF0157 family)